MSKAVAKRKPELLPINYRDAKTALARCDRVDECKTWSDKALALKSYAKQMKDTGLEDLAQRIRDRAVRRGGELLAQVKARRGGDRKSKGGQPPIDRKTTAKDAGLSPHQAKEMLRVAKVPEPEFERRVEAPKPATVTELAALGTTKAEQVEPPPYREEWLDWVHAIQHLGAIPACGLHVLAARRPDALEDLRAECAAAITNLTSWQQALETFHVRPQDSEHDADLFTQPDQRSAAQV